MSSRTYNVNYYKVKNSGDTYFASLQRGGLCSPSNFFIFITHSDLQNVFLKTYNLCELTDTSLKRNNFFHCKILERLSECSCADSNMVKKLYSIFSNIPTIKQLGKK
jgi:hypothetical protein